MQKLLPFSATFQKVTWNFLSGATDGEHSEQISSFVPRDIKLYNSALCVQ